MKEAEELGEQVLEIRKRILGEEHPDMLMSITSTRPRGVRHTCLGS